MKKHLLYLLVLVLVSCQKNKDAIPENDLIGTWRLLSYCKPTGTNSCTQVVVPNDKGVFIVFEGSASQWSMPGRQFDEYYENTRPGDYAFLGCGGGSYEIEEGGGTIRIRALCMSSLGGRLMKLVSLTRKQLILNPFGTGEYIFERKP